jgi:hypothetical protein
MAPFIRITHHAPSCPISRNQALPGMPGRYTPVPPRALDLPSAIAAVNALIQALQPGVNQSASHGSSIGDSGSYKPGQNSPEQDGGSLPKKKKRWEEKERKKCKIKYFSEINGEKDPNNWILIERITYLKFHDKVQKIDFEFYWTYERQDPYEQFSEFVGGDKGFSEYEQFRRKLFGPGGEGDDDK